MSYSSHALVENRNGHLVDFRVEDANGFAERDIAIDMLREKDLEPGSTVGGDQGYDTADFVRRCRELGVTPHVARTSDPRRASAVDARTTRRAATW